MPTTSKRGKARSSTRAAKPRRAAIYARCSTSEQSVEPQLDRLREYIDARGLELVEEYIDRNASGAKASRPALDRLVADAKRRAFDAIVVARLDRLGRSLHHLLTLLGELEALGVDLVSLDDGLDTSTPVGRLFFQIRGAFAEYERALIVERTLDGLAAARARGKVLGRPVVLDRRKRERALRLRRQGRSVREIAKALGISTGSAHNAIAEAPTTCSA